MDLKRIVFILIIVASATCGQAQKSQVIAHRGFWKTDDSAQNSIAALTKADSIGCYGSEFDVWLTKDNKLVVNHDPVYELKNIEKSTASDLTSLKLANGENLPTLKQYLEAGQKGKTRLILELKTLNTPERETKAVKEIVAMVKRMGLEKRMEYIAFSLHTTKEFIRLAPAGTPVFYLNGNLSPKELKEIGCAGPDYHLGVFQKHPEWIKECQNLGMKVNAWTVNKANDMKWLINQNIDFITTNEPVLLQSIISEP